MTRIDSVDPIISEGLADQIDVDGSDALEGISFHPTPGHTPHHAFIVLRSGVEHALFTGDVMHHPIQVCVPEWSIVHVNVQFYRSSYNTKLPFRFLPNSCRISRKGTVLPSRPVEPYGVPSPA